MKVELSLITKVRITEVKNLDLINVTLDDITPGKGRIMIECYGKSWSSYWGGNG